MFGQAIKSLWKHKLINLFIIIQLTLSFFSLLGSVTVFEQASFFENKARKIIDLKKTYFLREDNLVPMEEIMNNKENYLKFIDFLEENKSIKQFGTYQSTGVILDMEYNISEAQKKILHDNIDRYVASDRVPVINTLIIDENLNEMIKIPVEKGEFLSTKDFNKKQGETIPILLGSGFKQVFNIGDIIKIRVTEEKFQVIGFLDEGYAFLNSGRDCFSPFQGYDWGAIIPIRLLDYEDATTYFTRLQQGCIYTLQDGISNEAIALINGNIEKKAKDLNIMVKPSNLDKMLEEKLQENKKINNSILITGLCLMIFSCCTLIITILVFISRRKREFGIRIATGGNLVTIIKLVCSELSILIFISVLLNIFKYLYDAREYLTGELIHYLAGSISIASFQITFTMLWQMFLIVLFIIFITAILPIIKISKMEPKDLIGGIE